MSRATIAQDGTLSPSCGLQGLAGLLWLGGGHIQDPRPGEGKGVSSACSLPQHLHFDLLLPGAVGRLFPAGGSALPALLPYKSRASRAISCPSGSTPAREELPSIGRPLLAPRSQQAMESICESFKLGCFTALLPSQFGWLEISYPIPNPPKSQLGTQATPASKTEGDSFSFI